MTFSFTDKNMVILKKKKKKNYQRKRFKFSTKTQVSDLPKQASSEITHIILNGFLQLLLFI